MVNPFLCLDEDRLAHCFTEYSVISFEDGARISDGNSTRRHVYIVRGGVVRVSLLNSRGGERLLFYGREGTLVGDATCFLPPGDMPIGIEAVAMGPCEIIKVGNSDFREACLKNPVLAMSVLTMAYSKVARLIEQLELATFRDTTSQLAALIFALSHDKGREVQSAWRLQMTHQMLAAATGRTRVSVTYALNRLQEAGALHLGRGHIEVLDSDLLGRYAEEETCKVARER